MGGNFDWAGVSQGASQVGRVLSERKLQKKEGAKEEEERKKRLALEAAILRLQNVAGLPDEDPQKQEAMRAAEAARRDYYGVDVPFPRQIQRIRTGEERTPGRTFEVQPAATGPTPFADVETSPRVWREKDTVRPVYEEREMLVSPGVRPLTERRLSELPQGALGAVDIKELINQYGDIPLGEVLDLTQAARVLAPPGTQVDPKELDAGLRLVNQIDSKFRDVLNDRNLTPEQKKLALRDLFVQYNAALGIFNQRAPGAVQALGLSEKTEEDLNQAFRLIDEGAREVRSERAETAFSKRVNQARTTLSGHMRNVESALRGTSSTALNTAITRYNGYLRAASLALFGANEKGEPKSWLDVPIDAVAMQSEFKQRLDSLAQDQADRAANRALAAASIAGIRETQAEIARLRLEAARAQAGGAPRPPHVVERELAQATAVVAAIEARIPPFYKNMPEQFLATNAAYQAAVRRQVELQVELQYSQDWHRQQPSAPTGSQQRARRGEQPVTEPARPAAGAPQQVGVRTTAVVAAELARAREDLKRLVSTRRPGPGTAAAADPAIRAAQQRVMALEAELAQLQRGAPPRPEPSVDEKYFSSGR